VLDWLLKYPPSDFARGQLMFTGGWPSALLWAVLALGAVLLLALAATRRGALGLPRVLALAALQIAMLAVALVAVAQPALLLRSLKSGENQIALLLDDSGSMSFLDGDSRRLQQARAVLESGALRELARRYHVRRYVFSDSATPIDSYQALPVPGERTAIGDSLLQVLRALHTSALGAVVIVSDGSDSAGALSSETLAEIASYGVPVHTIGIGRARMPEDLELAEVLVPARALPGTTIAARATIRHDGAGTTRLKVYDGERFLGSRDVSLPEDAMLTSVPISFTLNETGERELRFTLEPKPEERELRNNTRLRMIDVAAGRANLLYVEGEPRWEYKFVRRALDKDSGVRLVSLLRTSTNGYYRQGIDATGELADGFPIDRKTLYAYDGLIIGSLPAAWFKPEQLQMIRDFVSERGGSLLMLAGPNGLGDGGWGDSVVGGILPTALPAGGGSFHRERAAVALTAVGRRTPMLELADDPAQNQQLWAGLPAVEDYQLLGPKRLAASVLLELKVGTSVQPLLVSQRYGRGRSLILATGGTWRWRMGLPSQDQRFDEFWRQLARSLVSDVPQPFDLSAETRGGTIQVRAEVRDPDFEPLSDVSVRVIASSPAERVSFTLQPTEQQPGVYQAQYRPGHSGSFVLEASAERGGSTLGSAHTTLRYEQGEAEYFGLRQNRGLLEQLAAATGGRYWQPDALERLPEAVRASPAGVVQQEILPLWNAPAMFLLLLALKCGEWLLRRRWSVV
jgi:uncharacterized membrane protein